MVESLLFNFFYSLCFATEIQNQTFFFSVMLRLIARVLILREILCKYTQMLHYACTLPHFFRVCVSKFTFVNI